MSPTLVDNRRIYSLPMLVTTWVFSILGELAVIGFAALEVYTSSITSSYDYSYCYGSDGEYSYSTCSNAYPSTSRASVTLISSAVVLALATIFLITRITQIVLYSQQKLSPTTNFAFDLSRFIILTIILVWIIVAAALFITSLYIILIVVPITWIFYLVAMIYSSVIFHRYRKGEYKFPEATYGQQPFWPGQVSSGPQQPYFFPGQVPFVAGQAQLIPGQPCPTCRTTVGAPEAHHHEIREHYQPAEKGEPTSHVQTAQTG